MTATAASSVTGAATCQIRYHRPFAPGISFREQHSRVFLAEELLCVPAALGQITAFCFPAVVQTGEFLRVTWLLPWQGLDVPSCSAFSFEPVWLLPVRPEQRRPRGTSVSFERS